MLFTSDWLTWTFTQDHLPSHKRRGINIALTFFVCKQLGFEYISSSCDAFVFSSSSTSGNANSPYLVFPSFVVACSEKPLLEKKVKLKLQVSGGLGGAVWWNAALCQTGALVQQMQQWQ